MQKTLFIDRDGTLIVEPEDQQVDAVHKVKLAPNVIPALLALKDAGYTFVMVSNQDGRGTESFPEQDFLQPHNFVLELFESQGITFQEVLVCPHFASDNCDCRKPKTGLLTRFLVSHPIDPSDSYVIGDREADVQLADNLGIAGFRIDIQQDDWLTIADKLVSKPRTGFASRQSNETKIDVTVDLDSQKKLIAVSTGIGFFDHMLEQLAKHGGFGLDLTCSGDLHIDDHHTVEDCALTLGAALRDALGDKRGIGRYGYLLPMDETQVQVSMDLSGRPVFVFEGSFSRDEVGGLTTEMVPHFFKSLCDSLGVTLHIHMNGENTHHQVEGIFKSVGRALGQALAKQGSDLPTTKGLL